MQRVQFIPALRVFSNRVRNLLLIFYVYGGGGYYLIGHYVVRPDHAIPLQTLLDDRIPFVGSFVWVYVMDYILPVLMVLLLRRVRQDHNLVLSYVVVFTLSFLVFIFYPVRMIRPGETGGGLSGHLLGWIYAIDDPPVNAFPSLHVAVSALTGLIVWHNRRRLGAVFLLIALCVSTSTLYVKQHWILDVVSGAVLGASVYWLVYRRR